ncbi:Hydroxycarboxylic acid receptor 2 [Nibea albiflora]|uniref:Hydroxycarboxylic acid receptor 2 n=1 Tax=Nibea albiflora TaxID=240163 RepID=A0ACB7EDG3_NIBAL|nr:Hydroxycarboxylic acid receptor 2 [Nibea albiflora]
MNATNEAFHCISIQNSGTLFLRIMMIIEVIVGLPLNIIALVIFCAGMKLWKPHTLFLFNLVIADLLVLISVPFRFDTQFRGEYWRFGKVWCNINLFMLAANRSASIAFMTVVALDRYFKVVHPHHRISHITLTQSGWLAGLIWISVVAFRIPLMTIKLLQKGSHEGQNFSWCRSFNAYNVTPLAIKVHYVAFTAEFFLPWFLLLFCSAQIAYSLHKRRMDKQKKVQKAILVVGVISLVFTFCFMPSIVTGLAGMYIRVFHPKDCKLYNHTTHLFMNCIGFTYLSSTLDPVIYCFSSTIFRDALKSCISRLGFKNFRAANSSDSSP